MVKINFTQENLDRLKALFVELGFNGEVLSGKFGANTYTVWEVLHNLTISTLKSINSNLKKEVIALEEQDDWTVSQYQLAKAAKTRKWQEFVNLVVGYKLSEQEKAEKQHEIKEKKEALKQIVEENKTPAERIAELQKEIEELEK
jgi:hypothetical protein